MRDKADETRRDETRRDETRRDETRRDEMRRDETRRDEMRRAGAASNIGHVLAMHSPHSYSPHERACGLCR